ncbi:hypothetical protein LSH36_123g03031 [Paralvinella palmiformis]|uniref:Uncharacterized protein n=1 Tax=Paralvinella palmiformis TaxID=53620 RepID=A0AAD9JXR0_9ANNE|nr:hypothetical protein LSH36_123g03031 [Paralvinella palmiformis]
MARPGHGNLTGCAWTPASIPLPETARERGRALARLISPTDCTAGGESPESAAVNHIADAAVVSSDPWNNCNNGSGKKRSPSDCARLTPERTTMAAGLGSTRTLMRTGIGCFVRGWFVDMITVYKIGMTRAGTVVTALALGDVVIGGVMLTLVRRDLWIGFGLWMGLILIICGVTCLARRQKRPEVRLSILSIISIIGFVASLVTLVTSSLNLWHLYDNPSKRYPRYVTSLPEYKVSLYAMNGILLGLSLVQGFFLCLALYLIIGYGCPCFRTARSSIYTIRIGEDRSDRILPPDPDTEMAAFNAFTVDNEDTDSSSRQRALGVQNDWIRQVPGETELTR